MTRPIVVESSTPTSTSRPVHPMDSSRLLLSLLDIASDSVQASIEMEGREGDWAVHPATLRRLISALAFRDESTVLHSQRVALLAVGIAQHMGWDDAALRKLEVAAVLHDVGKLGIPDHILHKPGRLSPGEQEFVLLHHQIAVSLLQACRIDREVVDMVWLAHAQGRVPLEPVSDRRSCAAQGARLLAVADAYDSLRHDQTYRRGKSHDDAMRLLNEQSGKQYDRNVVATLHRWIGQEGRSFLTSDAGRRLSSTLASAVSRETVRQAGELSHVFSFLYLLETLYDGFCLVDADERFVVWNHGLERLTGLTAQTMLGESWARKHLLLTDAQRQPLKERDCPLRRALAQGVQHCQQVKLEHRKEGRWHELELQAIPLVGAEGRTRAVALLFRDTSTVSRTQTGQYQQLQMAARRDPLTGVGNRGELEARLARLFAQRAEKTGAADPFAVIFLDLDHFKSINDTYGHAVGDRVLVNLARLVSDELYSGETICRYGGEEFVILCPETDCQAAEQRAERLRKSLMEASLADPTKLQITSSFGVAQVEPGDTVDALLQRADEALYEAKRTGRNRTCSRSNLKSEAAPVAERAQAGGMPFTHVYEFQTRVAADMVMYKLTGFVEDCQVRLQTVRPNRVEMQVGTRSLLGGWGRTPDQQPVKLLLELSEPQRLGRWATELITIRATLTPIGRCGRDEVFQSRANRVIQQLRAFFAVD